MNPNLERLLPYPFQRLSALLEGVQPNAEYSPIKLSIGEPKHESPALIKDSIAANLGGLSHYPTTQGSDALRQSIGAWIKRRYAVELDTKSQIIPVNGSREALFAFAQAVVDPAKPSACVISPNPFYQIYEGAAFLAGASIRFLNTTARNGFSLDFSQLSDDTWQDAQLIYVCSPGNPSGKVMSLAEWESLFALSDKHGFVIASDECYSEIYFDKPPLGALEAAKKFGRNGFPRLVVFSSLSKRSNVPGMRSGFVAGNSDILAKFLAYRTYHGCAMNPVVQKASQAAWEDEEHVAENRRLYKEKFEAVIPILSDSLPVRMPDAGFYLWVETPMDDTEFARDLYRDYNVLVLPGSFLAREAGGLNPGSRFVRIALVAPLEECVEAAGRIREFCAGLHITIKEK